MSDDPAEQGWPLFEYDPEPCPDSIFGDEPGVTRGYLYLWSGKPGPAEGVQVAALVGESGEITIVQDGDVQECEVYDDSGESR